MNTDEPEHRDPVTAPPRLPEATVLVVEDEPLIRMTIADELNSAGYRAIQAANGEEAKTYFRADEPIALIIADIDLPGMNGLALADWVRGEFADVGIILISGNPSNAAAARSRGRFFQKPFSIDALLDVVAQLCPVSSKAP